LTPDSLLGNFPPRRPLVPSVPDMALFSRKQKTAVGLDIGSGLVKVAVVDHGGAEPELVRVALAPLLPDAIVEGEVMDPAIVSDAIRTALRAAGVEPTKVATAVGGRDVIVKQIAVDRVPAAKAREALRWEAERHVPFDMDSVSLDFQILDPRGTDEQMEVLLVAAKRELIAARCRLLAEAGVTPSLVDVDSFALHNAFERSHPEAMSGVVALLHIGHELTNLNLVEDGVPVLTRDLGVGTRRLREDLQRDLGLSAEGARAILDAPDRSRALDTVLGGRVEELAMGIERAAAFRASSSHTFAPIGAIYLSGGGARTPGLIDALATRLRLPVLLATPLAYLALRDGAFESLETEAVAPLLTLAIGLALRSPR
jgi:type IV pilus assembly protein PilM